MIRATSSSCSTWTTRCSTTIACRPIWMCISASSMALRCAIVIGRSSRTCAVELGYADYLGALERYRLEDLHDPRLLRISNWLVDYPFADRVYAGALDAVKHAQQWAPVVILSDGDAVFQPRKVDRSGLWRAFDGHVLIYIHKEEELDDVERLYPAKHYVMIDDKLRILDTMKKIWGDRLTTVFPKQGHYAVDPEILAQYPHGDVQLDRIGDLVKLDLPDLVKQ